MMQQRIPLQDASRPNPNPNPRPNPRLSLEMRARTSHVTHFARASYYAWRGAIFGLKRLLALALALAFKVALIQTIAPAMQHA